MQIETFLSIFLVTATLVQSIVCRPQISAITADGSDNERNLDRGPRVIGEILADMSHMYHRQMDNIRRYNDCKEEYEGAIQGAVSCFRTLLGGLTPEEQRQEYEYQHNGKTLSSNFPEFLAQEYQLQRQGLAGGLDMGMGQYPGMAGLGQSQSGLFQGQGYPGSASGYVPGQGSQSYPGMGQLGQGYPDVGQSYPGTMGQLGQSFSGMGQLGQNYPGMGQLGQNYPEMGQLGQNYQGIEQLGQNYPGMSQGYPGMEQMGQNYPGVGQGQGYPSQLGSGMGFQGQQGSGVGFPGQQSSMGFPSQQGLGSQGMGILGGQGSSNSQGLLEMLGGMSNQGSGQGQMQNEDDDDDKEVPPGHKHGHRHRRPHQSHALERQGVFDPIVGIMGPEPPMFPGSPLFPIIPGPEMERPMEFEPIRGIMNYW